MNALVPKKTDPVPIEKMSKTDFLAAVPDSSVWLANFTSEQTRRTYQMAIREFISKMEITNENDWKKIRPAHAIAWRESMKGEGKSHRTIHTRLSALSSLFKHLCEQQVVRENPVRDVKRPQVETDQVASVVMTRQQAFNLLNAPGSDSLMGLRDRAILATLLYTGARIESVCRLRVGDFFEDGGYMVLEFNVKGGRKKRVPINQEHQATLKKYLMAAGHVDEQESPLFLGVRSDRDNATHLTQRYLRKMVKKYARQVDLSEKVTPHSARATFITEALNAGVPIEQVQNTVGHKNITTTKMYDKRRISYRESATFRVHY